MMHLRNIALFAFALTLVGCNGPEQPRFACPAFSADGKYLYCSYGRTTSTFIYRIALETGKATRLTSATSGYECGVAVSQDGKRIAYSYMPVGQRDRIILANPDGSGAHTIMAPDAGNCCPQLAINTTLVFARYGPTIAQPSQDEWNYYVTDIAGTAVRQLAHENFEMSSGSSVSPDGKNLLFVVTEGNLKFLAISSLEDPPAPKRILRPNIKASNNILNDPLFLPDGKGILLLAATTGANGQYDYDIYKIDLRTENVEKLTTGNGDAANLRVSPDGHKAVFVKDVDAMFGRRSYVILFDLATRQMAPLKVTGVQ